MSRIINIIDKIGNTALYRKKSVLIDFRKKKSKLVVECTNKQIREVKSFWNGLKINDYWFAFCNKVYNKDNHSDFDVRFLPDDIYFYFIDPYYNSREATKYLDDKNLYDLLYTDIKRPTVLLRKINGSFLDERYDLIDVDSVLSVSKGNFVSKIPYGPGGGKGIRVWKLPNDKEELKKYISKHKDIIIENFLEQHPLMSALHKESVNTIRLVTFYDNDEVSVLSKIIRMGTGGNYVDNAHSGGIFCGINDDGSLKQYAYNTMGDRFENHPTSNIRFNGYSIPNIEKCVKVVERLALRLSRTNRLLHWDLAIDKEGNPVFIEVNMAKGELDFHQMTNGPLFGNKTKKVIEDVFHDKSKRFIQRFLS